MTYLPFVASSVASRRNGDLFVGMRKELNELQRQMATGKVSETYGGLGFERRTALDFRGKLASLDGYKATIDSASLRINFMTTNIDALGKMAQQGVSDVNPAAFEIGVNGRTTGQNASENRLRQAIDILNEQINGQYLFSGRSTDVRPVASFAAIMDGENGQAGLKQLIAERKQADLGANGLGRLTLARTGTAIQLDESATARINFGFNITGAQSVGSNGISATFTAAVEPTATLSFSAQPNDGDKIRLIIQRPDGGQDFMDVVARTTLNPANVGKEFQIGANAAATAANLTTLAGSARVVAAQSPGGVLNVALAGGSLAGVALAVNTQPADGDVIRVNLRIKDGTQEVIELTARTATGNSVNANEMAFLIGADATTTAINLTSALDAALKKKADTALVGASTTIATRDFFAGSPSVAPRRIAGPPFNTATGFTNTAATNTVTWYRGDDKMLSPRDTAVVRVDSTQVVGTGAQANEAGFQQMLARFAALTAETFTTASGEADRYSALASRIGAGMGYPDGSPTIASTSIEIGQATATMKAAKDRHNAMGNMLMDSVANIETADTEQIAASVLALQTRLQASYQTTSILSRLSLVNFM